jgi:hypothetical protein
MNKICNNDLMQLNINMGNNFKFNIIEFPKNDIVSELLKIIPPL